MILPFSNKIDGKPSYFAEKIAKSQYELLTCEEDKNTFLFAYNLVVCNYSNDLNHTSIFDLINAKKHTIREDKNDRWKPGRLIHPYYHNRTKKAFQCAPTMHCLSTQPISIVYYRSEPIVMLHYSFDSDIMTEDEIETLAINDGFDTVDDFFKWFNKDFHGKIVHWTELRY